MGRRDADERERGDPDWSKAEIAKGHENIFDEMKNQWEWSGFTAHSLKQSAHFAEIVVIVAKLWNGFARLGRIHVSAVVSGVKAR